MPRKKLSPKRRFPAGAGPIKPDTPAYRLVAAVVKEIVDDLIRRAESEAAGGTAPEPSGKPTVCRRFTVSRPTKS
jgi:hypothetical protein